MREYRGTPEYAEGVYLPLVIDLIKTTATVASPDYRESAREVVAGLEPHRGKTYDELIELIHAV
jgi:hypothetical protein